jgi:type IV secretion system protein VirD4
LEKLVDGEKRQFLTMTKAYKFNQATKLLMGLSDDIGWEVTRMLMGFFAKIAAAMVRLVTPFGKPKKVPPRPKRTEEKNPRANERVTSLEKNGVFFGMQSGKYVIKPEEMDGHVLVTGTPGSGKSTCIAIPTLRSWKGSVFAVDIKGELYANVKEYRTSVKVFDPQDKNAAYSYDPYVFLNESTNPAQEARAIAQAVISLPTDTREPFWIESAQILLTGAILHYHNLECSFIETLKNIQSQTPQALVKNVANSDDDKAVLCAKSFVDMDSKVLAGIFTEMSRGIITLVTDNDIVAALSREKGKGVISPLDLEKGHDVYIKIPEHLLRQWKHLLSLMVNQFITFFERRDESPDNKPILFLLDEFPRLGKIPAITDVLATLRSKKITICIIIQSLAQLKMIYGHDAQEVIADTCAYKAVLGATDANTQEYFSKLVGTYEKIRRSQSRDYDPYIGAPKGSGTSLSEDNERRIIKPEEFATLQEIILLYPLPGNFCRVQKQPHYLDNGGNF